MPSGQKKWTLDRLCVFGQESSSALLKHALRPNPREPAKYSKTLLNCYITYYNDTALGSKFCLHRAFTVPRPITSSRISPLTEANVARRARCHRPKVGERLHHWPMGAASSRTGSGWGTRKCVTLASSRYDGSITYSSSLRPTDQPPSINANSSHGSARWTKT